MSLSNASRRAPALEDIPRASLSDLAFEGRLRAAGVPHTVSVRRRDGSRCIGAVWPKPMPAARAVEVFEQQLAALSETQGLSTEGHSRERQQARGRQDEPTADAQTTTRTLSRRG